MKWFQQGDVTVKPTVLPNNAQPFAAIDGKFILREGEATGHHHAIVEQPGVILYTLDQILYMVNEAPVTLTHQEHATQTIPSGTWVIGAVREYDYLTEEARYVVD